MINPNRSNNIRKSATETEESTQKHCKQMSPPPPCRRRLVPVRQRTDPGQLNPIISVPRLTTSTTRHIQRRRDAVALMTIRAERARLEFNSSVTFLFCVLLRKLCHKVAPGLPTKSQRAQWHQR